MNVSIDNYINMLTEAELLFLSFLFAWNFPKRKRFWLYAILFSFVFIGLSFLTYSIDVGNSVLSGALNYLLLSVFVVLTLGTSFQTRISTIVFCTLVAYTTRHLIYLFWQLSIYIYNDCTPNPVMTFSWIWVIFSCGWIVLFAPVVLYIYHLIKKTPDVTLPPWKIIILAALSLFVDNILNMFVVASTAIEADKMMKYVISSFNILSCVMILAIMFSFVSQSQLEKEVASISQMRHEEEKQYQMTKENIDLINVKCHDLRKQLRVLQEAHSTISQQEINSIEEATRIYDTRVETGNSSLDVILRDKSLICAKNKIVFNCIIDGSALNFISESDIFSLFGNIVDNAIESAMKLTLPEKRIITLKIRRVPGGVFIYEENYYIDTISYSDGLPVSTKGDKQYHGFGMKSIRMIVNHYSGTMQINSKNQTFALSVFFPRNN